MQVDDKAASPCSEISFAARASGTHNRCDVEVQRTRRAAGRHYGSRTTDERDTHRGPAHPARSREAPPLPGRQRVALRRRKTIPETAPSTRHAFRCPPRFAPSVRLAAREAVPPPRAAGPPSANDRDRRLDRHGPVRRVRRVDLAGRPRRRDARVHGDRPDGLFPDDEPRRNGRVHARVGFVRDLRREVRRRRLRLRARLELLVQLGRHAGGGARRRAARDALLVSACAGRLVERAVPHADLRAQRAVGARLWRSRILVRADQGADGARVRRRRPADDLRDHAGRPERRLGQLHDRRRAVRRRLGDDARRRDDRGLLVPGHRNDRRRGRRIGEPAHDDPARGEADLLAHPAVLRVRDLRDRRADSLYRPEPAEERRDRHRRESVYAGVPPRGPRIRGRRDERSDPDGRAVGRQLGHVRVDADALQPRGRRPRAEAVREAVAGRRAAQCAVRDDRRRRTVFPHVAVWRQDRLPVAAEHVGHGRLHHVARHRGQPLPVPQGLPQAGLSARPVAVPVEVVPVRPAVRIRAVRGRRARPGLPGVPRRQGRLGRHRRDLHRPAVLPRDLARLRARAQMPPGALRGHGDRAVDRTQRDARSGTAGRNRLRGLRRPPGQPGAGRLTARLAPAAARSWQPAPAPPFDAARAFRQDRRAPSVFPPLRVIESNAELLRSHRYPPALPATDRPDRHAGLHRRRRPRRPVHGARPRRARRARRRRARQRTGRLRRIGPQRRLRIRRLQPRQRRPAAHARPRRRAPAVPAHRRCGRPDPRADRALRDRLRHRR
ncbi:hypothetical protein EMIT0111MI5_90026 [Burkholderia sp. IT-111MI5]